LIDHIFIGITLTKETSGESDSVVSILTREFGKITALARSAQRVVSKLGPHLEPLRLIEGRLVEKKRSCIADALTQISFRHIRSDPVVFAGALRILAFVREHAAELEQNDLLWETVSRSLRLLDQAVAAGALPSAISREQIFSQIHDKLHRAFGYQ